MPNDPHTERERAFTNKQTNRAHTHTSSGANDLLLLAFNSIHRLSCDLGIFMATVVHVKCQSFSTEIKKQNFRRLYSRSFAQLKYLRLLRVKCVQSMRIYQMKWNLALKFQHFEAYRTDGGWKLANRLLFHLTVERNKNFSSDSIIT